MCVSPIPEKIVVLLFFSVVEEFKCTEFVTERLTGLLKDGTISGAHLLPLLLTG